MLPSLETGRIWLPPMLCASRTLDSPTPERIDTMDCFELAEPRAMTCSLLPMSVGGGTAYRVAGSLKLHTYHAYYACMTKRQSEQYTIRGVPARVGTRLRERARAEGRSLNSVAVDALARGLGVGDVEMRYTDLDDLAGTWVPDPEFDRVVAEMDRVDEELWK